MKYRIYNVFGDGPIEGNPTGVVYFEGAADTGRMQKIAHALAVPDTLFIMPSDDPGLLFTSLAFTPYQEISICGQGMIGGLYSWMEDRGITSGHYRIGTQLGHSTVTVADSPDARVFVSMGIPSITALNETETCRVIQIAGEATPLRSALVALGRKRLLIQVDAENLAETDLVAGDVMRWCAALGVTGIVVFATEKSGKTGTWRSRHFTTSLLGAEDAVTGGASAAILAFCRHVGGMNASTIYTVHQGGFKTREGLIYTRFDAESGEVFVGGKAVRVFEASIDV